MMKFDFTKFLKNYLIECCAELLLIFNVKL